MSEPFSICLPPDWGSLGTVERFNLLRQSGSLVRGSVRPDADVDCHRRLVVRPDAGEIFHFNYPTREQGSFSYSCDDEIRVTGELEPVDLGGYFAERYFILTEPKKHQGGGAQPYQLSREQLSAIASLMETYQNHCVAKERHHIAVYVTLQS